MNDTLSLIAIAVAPGLAISFYVFYHDKYEKEPLGLLALLFVAGCLSTIPAIFAGVAFQAVVPAAEESAFLTAFVTAGALEELSKFGLLYLFAWRRRDFDEPYDGIMYSVMVAMGFATLENVLYVFQGGWETGLLRMFTAVPAHAAFGILMGYWVGLAKFRPLVKGRLIFYGLASAILLHGLYDYFLMQQIYGGLVIGALVSLVLGIIMARRAMRLHVQVSPHRPDTVSGVEDEFLPGA